MSDSFPPFHFYLDSLSSPRKNPLERSPSQGRQAGLRPPAWNRLRSSCMLIRVDDLDIHQVRSPGPGRCGRKGVGQFIWKATSVNTVVRAVSPTSGAGGQFRLFPSENGC